MKDFLRTLHLKSPVSYYYVPPCPKCGSRMTGRFVKEHGDADTEFIVRESLKHGELVSPAAEIPDKNLFCAECGYTWEGQVHMRFITFAQMQEEIEARGTKEILEQELDEEEDEKKNRPHGLFETYIGRL